MSTRLAFKIRDAADHVGVSVDTIRRAIFAGQLKAKRTGSGGGHYLIHRSALEEWFDQLPDA